MLKRTSLVLYLTYCRISGREVLNLICPQCPSLSFRLMSDLKRHLETEHGMKDMSADLADDPSDEEDNEQEETDSSKEKVVSILKPSFSRSLIGISHLGPVL